jgi:hypothetical protein
MASEPDQIVWLVEYDPGSYEERAIVFLASSEEKAKLYIRGQERMPYAGRSMYSITAFCVDK